MLELNFSPFPEIKTKRLILRRMKPGDAYELFKMRSSKRVMKYIDRERTKKIEDAKILLDSIENDINHKTGIMWGITIIKNPEKIIGNIGYWRIMKEHYRAEIGFIKEAYFKEDFFFDGTFRDTIIYSRLRHS